MRISIKIPLHHCWTWCCRCSSNVILQEKSNLVCAPIRGQRSAVVMRLLYLKELPLPVLVWRRMVLPARLLHLMRSYKHLLTSAASKYGDSIRWNLSDSLQIASFEVLLDGVNAWFAAYYVFNYSYLGKFKKSSVYSGIDTYLEIIDLLKVVLALAKEMDQCR